MLKQDADPYSTYVLKDGYEKVWKTIVEVEKLDVVYNVDIVGVSRLSNGSQIDIWRNSRVETELCDFIIWTPPMSELLRVLRSPLEEEQRLFSSLRSEYYTASLVELKGAVRHSPYTTYMAQWVERPEHGVIVDMDTSGVHTPGIRTPGGVAAYDRLEGGQTKSCIQLGKEPASKARLEEILRQHYMDGFDATTMEVLALKTWSYMPRLLYCLS